MEFYDSIDSLQELTKAIYVNLIYDNIFSHTGIFFFSILNIKFKYLNIFRVCD